MMRASLFEVWKLTQRTLEGADAPDGHDREGAFAVQWLAERGFPGVVMFNAAKPEMASFWKLAISDLTELLASGNPLVCNGADVIDYCVAVAETSDDGKAVITVKSARGPVFLLPFAARRCLNAGTCTIQWIDADDNSFSVTVAGAETVWIDCQSEKTSDLEQNLCDVVRPVDVSITFDQDGAGLRAEEDAPEGNVISPSGFKERRTTCLASGIEVDQPLWDKLQSMARVVLVPATEHSREIGAGGGDAND